MRERTRWIEYEEATLETVYSYTHKINDAFASLMDHNIRNDWNMWTILKLMHTAHIELACVIVVIIICEHSVCDKFVDG
jgi:hypothetical protein